MQISKLTVEIGSGDTIDYSVERNGDMISLERQMENETIVSKYQLERADAVAEFIFNSTF